MALKFNKTWGVLAVALTIGVVAALAARHYLAEKLSEGQRSFQGSTVRLAVARADLPKGTVLSLETVVARSVPADFAQSAAVRPEQFDLVAGRKLNTALRAGEFVMWAQVEDPNGVAFSMRVADGRRAISVPVDEINSLSGMLQPGDKIDLYVSLAREQTKMVVPVLQNIAVLAAGNRATIEQATGDRRSYTTITLDASTEEARILVLARDAGRMTAMLRNPGDARAIAIPSNVEALLTGSRPPVAMAAPMRPGVQVLVGGRPTAVTTNLGPTQEVEALSRLASAVERLSPGENTAAAPPR